MTWRVQMLVRDARLPRSVKRRPEVKAVLLALADKCLPDGTNARPAVATIAAEVEISVRTVHACLATLRDLNLIAEQAPPRQHKPRVWRLNLPAIKALDKDAAPQHPAALTDSNPDAQHAADLTSPDVQASNPHAQDRESGAQLLNPDAHAVAEDPVSRILPLIPSMNRAPSALDSHPKQTTTTVESDEQRQHRLTLLEAMRLRYGITRRAKR